ncbi:MAG: hypothetical protein P4L84_25040 [Isosphaeraceae bacterium]|nr:hypothetical protein [Isosphaeraceae bacterium]
MNQTQWNEPWADGEPQGREPAVPESAPVRLKTWKLRYDAAALPQSADSLADRDVLSFFRKQLRPGVQDGERRASPRLPALERDAWLGWWEDDEFLIAPAVLENISRGGVRLSINKPIGVDQPCWLCLGPPSPVVCVRSLVLGIARGRNGFDVRLVFTMGCPEQLYDVVVNGRPSD